MGNLDNCSVWMMGKCDSLFSPILLMFNMFYNDIFFQSSFLVFPQLVGCFSLDDAFILWFYSAVGPLSSLYLNKQGKDNSEIHTLLLTFH